MAGYKTVPESTLRALQAIDTCTVSNAVEQFQVRTRNEGFVSGAVRCIFPQMAPRVGYAATATIQTASTPMTGQFYYDRGDWWEYVRSCPGPRFLVVKDVDDPPGLGALFGEIHAAIGRTLDCVAYLTNGAVRDLPGVERLGIQLFAGSVSVSHSYAHVVDFGQSVEIGGLEVKPGDLLHADQHGVLCVPFEVASQVPEAAARIQAAEAEFINACMSKGFDPAELSERIHQLRSEQAGLKANHDPSR